MENRKKTLERLVLIAFVHIFIVSLSINCGSEDSIGHGPYFLDVTVPGQADMKKVEFFLDEPVGEGEIMGFVSGANCDVYVDICYSGYCETIFWEYVPDSDEYIFEVHSDDSIVFSDYLEDFSPCYKDNEFLSEPFSCQKWSCGDSRHDLTVILDSSCRSSLTFDIEVKYLDLRIPFLGPLTFWGLIEEVWDDDCFEYECYYEDGY
jgi:hypothetical protein